jgi:hypothetical protein
MFGTKLLTKPNTYVCTGNAFLINILISMLHVLYTYYTRIIHEYVHIHVYIHIPFQIKEMKHREQRFIRSTIRVAISNI